MTNRQAGDISGTSEHRERKQEEIIEAQGVAKKTWMESDLQNEQKSKKP